MAWLEGSMVEGYVLDKTLGFVTNYLHEFEHVLKRVWDGKENEVFGKVLKGVHTKFVFSPIIRSCTQICINKYKKYKSMDIMNSFQHHSLHSILFVFSSTLCLKMENVVFVACCLRVETLNQINIIIINLDFILVNCKCN
jgi:hypothetical protein